MPGKRRLLFITILLFMFLTSERVYAVKKDITGRGKGYLPVLYDNSNGLPTSEANAIVQSEDGFIWIGGYSGLIRYDGNEFYRYDASLGITSVVSLYVDSRDRLWVGTNDNGVALYEDGTFRFFGKDKELNSMSIRSITEDGDGNIFIATTEGLAYIDTDNVLHKLDNERLNEEYICQIKRDEDGIIYGETLSGSFFSVDSLEVTGFYNGQELGIGVVVSICPDPKEKGCVYLGTENSNVIWGNMQEGMKRYKILSAAPQVNINDIIPVEDMVWICADNGIGYLDSDGSYIEIENIPMNNSVDGMMVDYEENLWFVSSRQGVMKICKSRFTDISQAAGLENLVVNSTCMCGNDLYIGTDTGLYLLDRNLRQKTNALTELLEGVRIRCIKEDSTGKLWICTYSDFGLICYSDGDYRIYDEKAGMESNRIRDVIELSDGTIAVASSGGVTLIRGGKITGSLNEKNGINNTEILSICEGDDGKIYLGSDGGGIYIVEGSQVSHLGLDDGLKSEIVLRIKKDVERSIYWIITSNSISYMKGDRIETLSHFPYSNNFDLFFDSSGGIWFLSSNGIYVVNGDQILKDKEIEYSFYDKKCGLPSMATANSRSCLEEDGTLYISGSTGVSSVNINEREEVQGGVKLAVPFIEVDGETVVLKEDEELVIPSSCKRLTIYGYALTYSLHNPRLSYYLEGFDDTPETTSRQDMKPMSYTNLTGGKYVFHLSIIDVMTGEEQNTIAVTLIKERAFYEHGWFWIFVAVLIVLLAIAISWCCIRHKTAVLERKQKENRIFIEQIIQSFAKSIDIKDKYTNGHSFRVAEYAAMMAERMGYDSGSITDVYNIGLLHDIGKITIPDEILNKPGRLTDEEYDIIKKHASNGYDILKEIEISPDLALGAGYHHERIDGKGYPFGKNGEEIPIVAQIIAVADTFDAMNSTRPYRKQMRKEDIIAELERIKGTQLNAEIVQILLDLIEEGLIETGA
ncbi:MAG: HD domain-containing protein [Lachnospiraceae bacterium]|nr:HD domain-containing protein [Lachnospiraceae bacterium]